MKRIINTIALSVAIFAASSCTKKDNYAAPDQTLQGSITDVATGQGIQGEINGNSTRVRLVELSWSPTATPQDLSVRQDGTYTNTKLFKGTYRVVAEGPFVPLVQTTPAVDQTQTIELNGEPKIVNFKVEPLLRVEWVGQPVLNANGTISAQAKVTRGTTNAAFQNNITEITLFISSSPYIGNNINETARRHVMSYSGTTANAILGTNLTFTTTGGALITGREYYIRVGAKTNYGLAQYNYTDVRKVVVP